MGLTDRRLARLVAAAVLAVLVAGAAACGSDAPTGGVDSNDVRRPTPRDTTAEASGDGDAQPVAADLGFGNADAELAPDDVSLTGVGYVVGDCVTWEAVDSGPTATQVVPCTDQHRFQVTGATGPPGSTLAAYPDDAEWDALRYRACAPQADTFLGRPLDPRGRFAVSILRPTPESWAQGGRSATCGIISSYPSDDEHGALFVGDVREATDQGYDFAPGTCLSSGVRIVACTEPHEVEVVARLTYPEAPTAPDEAAHDTVRGQCLADALAYLGSMSPPWGYGIESLGPESWAAGSRHVHCFVGHIAEDGAWVESTGPAPRG